MATSTFILVTQGGTTKFHTVTEVIGADTVHQEVVKFGEPYLPGYVVRSGAAISVAVANDHVLQIVAGSSLKVRIRRIEIYQVTLATTVAIATWNIVRLTSAGTGGTGVAAAALETSDAAAGATAMTLPTAKGTEGTVILPFTTYFMQTLAASNQLVNPIAVIDFDLPRTKPLIIAAGTSNGIAIKNVTAVPAASVFVNVWLDETSF